MPDSSPQRLASVHLEDLTIVALTALAGGEQQRQLPDLDNQRRARLRSRLKQIGRHDWPSNQSEDPLLRRGYTLRQCCRLLAALLLIDAHLAPSEAIALAKANELSFLRVIASRLSGDNQNSLSESPEDLLIIVPLGELTSLVDGQQWRTAQPQALRSIQRADLSSLWSDKAGLGFAGQRLIIDIGAAATAMWRWIAEQRLMTDDARTAMLTEIAMSHRRRGFAGGAQPVPRR